jgi:spermidine synthase
MLAWEKLDGEAVPGDDTVMELLRRGTELVIRVSGRELMSSRVHGSEDALADLACDRLKDRPAARILVGGLGMGFTLAAALRGVGPEGQVTVAELVPAVVRWSRGPIGPVAGHPLSDPRAVVYPGDVADMVRQPPQPWDAILLDVDNGPHGLTRATNDWLYTWQGLAAAHAALTPKGILAVWSAADDRGFTRRVERAGFDVEPVEVRARGKKGGHRHVIWLGVKKG